MMLHPVSKLIEALTLETLGVNFLFDFFILKEISNVFMIIEAFLFIKKTRCGVEEVGSILNSCLVRSVC